MNTTRTVTKVPASSHVDRRIAAWRGHAPSTGSHAGRRPRAAWAPAGPDARAASLQLARSQPAAGLVREPDGAKSFAVTRIRHAVELVSACMLIVVFLALAMFV